MDAAGGDGGAPVESPVTATGVALSVVVPLPSWPKTLSPQHLTVPPVLVSAQVWKPPAAIGGDAAQSPDTATGVELSVVVPLPSWP